MIAKILRLLPTFCLGMVAALLLAAAVIYGVLASGCMDPGADQPIPPIERWAAKTSIRAFLKQNTPKINSPLQVSEENLSSGVRLYVNNCAVCHGLSDGTKTKINEGFYKDAPLFAKEDWSKDADGLVYWFIEHGVRLTAMPAYKKTLNETEKWQLVMFIKEMGKLPAAVNTEWRSFKTVDVAK